MSTDNKVLLSVIIAMILLLSYAFYFSKNHDNSDNGEDSSNGNSEKILWGVDSAAYTDSEQLQCVEENFGKPKIWGRYLGDQKDVSVGIDADEVDLLHEEDIQILPIYNHLDDATGHDNGADHGKKAISYAKDLDMPEDIAIFADIEPDFPVDSAFIEGWYETLADSKFKAGLYGVFDEDSKLVEAFDASSDDAKEDIVIWTAHPQEGITSKDNAPEYNPDGPDAKKYGWQYGIDAEDCTIDTNLFKGDMLDYTW